MNNVELKLKNTPEQIELFEAAASSDSIKRAQAQEAIAKFIGPVIRQVIDLAGFTQDLYDEQPYNEDDTPMFPLDLYYGAGVNSVTVWQQNSAGGLGTTNVYGLQEMPIQTFRLDSAVSFNEKTIRRGRLPYISLGLNRMAQELLRKVENNGFYILLKALAEARTNSLEHLIQSATADVLQLDDFNKLITRSKRINSAWDGGTPTAPYSNGATDLYLSPEMMEQIRAFAYQPMNTRGVPNSDESTVIPLPERIREEIYNNAGVPEIYGKAIHELHELGISKRYNTIFDNLYSGALTFGTANQELVIGVDRSRKALIKPIAQNADNSSTFESKVDDQWTLRSGKLGWFTAAEMGFVCVDSRILSGLVIQ